MEFTYVAKTKEGRMQSGVVEANSMPAAVGALQSHDLIILRLDPVSSTPLFAKQLKFLQRVKNKDLVSFIRQLSTLFSAKVPLLQSLGALARQTDNAYFREVILETASDIEGGNVFSAALARHPKAFSDFFVNMVRSGEASGMLESTLLYLADYLERQYYLNSKLRGAMIYPGFIMFGFLVVGVLMMTMVVPNLTSILKETGQELPITTKIIIAISDFLRAFWWAVFPALFGGIAGAFYMLKHSAVWRYNFDVLKLKTPVFGKIFKKIYVSRLADNLSTLIQGGLPILQALQISASVVGNVKFRDIILEAKEQVRMGGTISGALGNHPEIPNLVTQMVATGEQTGSLDDILKKLSLFYNKEVDTTVETLSQLIEPVLIVVMGAAVAVLVAAILMPIYNMAGGM